MQGLRLAHGLFAGREEEEIPGLHGEGGPPAINCSRKAGSSGPALFLRWEGGYRK